MAVKESTTQVTFRNILFATDFSAAANLAMPVAAGLAKSFRGKLYVLHVHEPANYALAPEASQVAQTTREMETQCLREVVNRDFPGGTPEILEGEGLVLSTILAASRTHDIDLIVVGTRGRGGLRRALLGSTAEELVRHADCPVLTVGPQTQSRWDDFGDIKSILYATDFGAASVAALRVALSLTQEHGCKLTLLHVAGDHSAVSSDRSEAYGDTSESRLRDLVPASVTLRCPVDFVVAQGGPADEILEMASRVNADLIVMGAHEPKGLPGAATHSSTPTIHKVVGKADCLVLTCRARSECDHTKSIPREKVQMVLSSAAGRR
jgi:nucleotide-binding universal stress UspA family protein